MITLPDLLMLSISKDRFSLAKQLLKRAAEFMRPSSPMGFALV